MKEKGRKLLKAIANAWKKLSKMVAGFLGEQFSKYAHKGEPYFLDEMPIRNFLKKWRKYFGREFSDFYSIIYPGMEKAEIRVLRYEKGVPVLEVSGFCGYNIGNEKRPFELTWYQTKNELLIKDKNGKEAKYKIEREKGLDLCYQISLYEETFQLADGETMLKHHYESNENNGFIRWSNKDKTLTFTPWSVFIDELDDEIIDRITKEIWPKIKSSEYVGALEMLGDFAGMKIGALKVEMISYRDEKQGNKTSADIDDNGALLRYSVEHFAFGKQGTYIFDEAGFTYKGDLGKANLEIKSRKRGFEVQGYIHALDAESAAAELRKTIEFGMNKHSELF